MDQILGLPGRLREERERLGLAQTAFGRLAEVSKNSQIAYEQGKASPDINYLRLIGEMGVDIGYLITGVRSVSRPGMKPEEIDAINQLVQNFWELSDSGRQRASGLLGAMVHQEFEAKGSTRTTRRISETRVADDHRQSRAGLDASLLVTCLAGVEEGLEASGRIMDPEKKAELVVMLYDLHLAADSPPQKATILQFIKRAA